MRTVIAAFLIVFSFGLFAQSSGPGVVDRAVRTKNMIEARHLFLSMNVQGALSIYRQVVSQNPEFSKAYLKSAECAYELHRYKLALEYFDKALELENGEVGSEFELLAGKIHHRLESLDEAEKWYTKYAESVRGSGRKDAQRYLKEVERVREAKKNPLDVTFTWLGQEVNSRYDDYSPILIKNGTMLVFGTRRPQSTGSLIDVNGDYKYYEDIFYSELVDGEWTHAKPLPGRVNTVYHDGILGASEDASMIYVYKNNNRVQGDIYVSKKGKNGEYGTPRRFEEINSSYYEGSVSFTSDGNAVYFISERKGGLGNGDIWKMEKNGNTWGEPSNLGPVVNTPGDEKFVFVHPNGKSLVFASNGGAGYGDYDLYKTEITNGVFSKPVNLGYPINSVGEESTFSLSQDFNTLYLSTERPDAMGERDLYSVDMSAVELIEKPVLDDPSKGVLKGAVVNAAGEFLDGVTVKLINLMGKVVGEMKTNGAGEFEFECSMNQPYELETKPVGYLTRSEKIDFAESEGGYLVKNLIVRKLADTIDE